ncbi:zinc-dependent metalloprotease [Membranihabitans maritimus]|uniref:zinc-dependent metalloprotease n=1 Tax=Membranihabitans maritimus TaxID=2904244 RepID=UPI001F484F97|nr:zinc-dependent metalloprotease [Membranihabitans maritimus]
MNAQKTGFLEPVPAAESRLNLSENQRFMQFKNRDVYKDVILVNTSDLAGHQEDQVVSFRIPGVEGVVRARAKKIEARSLEDYLWNGEIIGEHGGSVYLQADKGEVYGMIRVDDRPFELYALQQGLSLLMESNRSAVAGQVCGSTGESEGKETVREQPRIEVRSCGYPRILVVASPDAVTARGGINGIEQLANTCISQLDDAFDNSDLNIHLQLVGVEELDGFSEPSSIVTAVSMLESQASSLRDDYYADLVVMISDRYDAGVIGRAEGFGPPNAYAVVNEHAASTDWVFVHEVGHLYEARHEGGGDLDICLHLPGQACDNHPDYAHAHHFETGFIFKDDHWTVMRSIIDLPGPINYFSNPDVEFDGEDTGVENVRDNARRINNNRCAVGNLKGDPPPPFSVEITGPTYGYNNTLYTWCFDEEGCSGTVDYLWEYSTDGFQYDPWLMDVPVGCQMDELPMDQDLYIRLRADCSDGQDDTDFHVVENRDASPLPVANDVSEGARVEYTEDVKNRDGSEGFAVRVYPNPTSASTVNTSITLPQEGKVQINLVNQLGQRVKSFPVQNIGQGISNIPLDLGSLTPGLYFLRTVWKDRELMQKFILTQ